MPVTADRDRGLENNVHSFFLVSFILFHVIDALALIYILLVYVEIHISLNKSENKFLNLIKIFFTF